MAVQQTKVVIVGAGIAGLTAAHCLQKAGIDHVVLEKTSGPHLNTGAGIIVYPHSLRILSQLGILHDVAKLCIPLGGIKYRNPDGSLIGHSKFFPYITEQYGYETLLLERAHLLKVLYDTLPDKSKVFYGRRVNNINHVTSGVEVSVDDGQVFRGDIVIGADGVYSAVRQAMWKEAERLQLSPIPEDDKSRMKTAYKAVIGVADNIPGFETRDGVCVLNEHTSVLLFTQPDRIYFFVFQEQEPFKWPERRFFSEADTEKAAAEAKDIYLSPEVTFGDIWKNKIRGTMVNIEEGVLKQWHSGRIVLTGDAAHKCTPNAGLGGNNTIESVAVLCNQIHQLYKEPIAGSDPNFMARLSDASNKYQSIHMARAQRVFALSTTLTQIHLLMTKEIKAAALTVLAGERGAEAVEQVSNLIRGASKLDYVRASSKKGSIGFDDEQEMARL